jgi:aldose 1-epimerase
MSLTDIVTLEAGDLSVEICPPCGGSIAAFRWHHGGQNHDLLHAATAQYIADREPQGMGCFPLAPYWGDVQGGGFTFAGKEWPVPLNHPWEPVPVHGEGWISEWHAVDQGEGGVVLEFSHPGGEGFPFPYRARESFALTPQSLRVEVVVTNTGDADMPAGTGLHPYFDRTADSTLELSAAGVREAGSGPPEAGPVPPRWDFSAARVLDDDVFEVLYSGWKHRATIAWPGRGVAVVMTAGEPLEHLCLWTPDDRPYFCVEPVSNIADGINQFSRGVPGTGIRVLAPGESISAWVVFEPLAWGGA